MHFCGVVCFHMSFAPQVLWLYTTQLFVNHQVGIEVKSDVHGSSPLFSALSEQWGKLLRSLMVQCFNSCGYCCYYTTLGSQYSILLRSKMQILRVPIPPYPQKTVNVPAWSGLIYIHCDNGQKVLKKIFLINIFCNLNVIILLMALTFHKSNWGPFSPNSS